MSRSPQLVPEQATLLELGHATYAATRLETVCAETFRILTGSELPPGEDPLRRLAEQLHEPHLAAHRDLAALLADAAVHRDEITELIRAIADHHLHALHPDRPERRNQLRDAATALEHAQQRCMLLLQRLGGH